MPANIYKAIRGHVYKLKETSPSIITMKPEITGRGEVLVVTGIVVQRNQVTQYIKTLDDHVFGYSWGEGVGTIEISGHCFLAKCDSPSGESYGNVNSYYDANNVYKKRGAVSISAGDATYIGYLERLTLAGDMSTFNFGQFSMQFSIIKPN
jgi:hypothetical protein